MAPEKSSTSTPKGYFEPSYPTSNETEAGPSNTQTENDYPNEDSNNHHDLSTPPAYSAPHLPSQPPPRAARQPSAPLPGIPNLPYSYYQPPTFVLSSDKTKITSTAPHLNHPSALLPLLHSLCALPPKPVVHIVGRRESVDFHIKMNLMSLIVGEGKAKMNYMKVIARGERGWRGGAKEAEAPHLEGLDEWVKMYCADGSAVKEMNIANRTNPSRFILTRQITNFSTQHLQGLLLSWVAQMGYDHHVSGDACEGCGATAGKAMDEFYEGVSGGEEV
ncbi:hypothetical protein CJF30_00008512 [Rutstroemia sp. NJR-2017a BBW]|nr:hypothetical protein CJF30_00008512 [Rutstroemia sp. NJR-2017a BBW]